jgi:hypothetical protein
LFGFFEETLSSKLLFHSKNQYHPLLFPSSSLFSCFRHREEEGKKKHKDERNHKLLLVEIFAIW